MSSNSSPNRRSPARQPSGNPSIVSPSSSVAHQEENGRPISEIIEELKGEDQAGGDGGDSDIDGVEVELHDTITGADKDANTDDVELENAAVGPVEIKTETVKAMIDLTSTGGRQVLGAIALDGSTVTASSEEQRKKYADVKIHRQPDDWKPPQTKTAKGEPEFSQVDNPGNWPEYCFGPKFSTRGSSGKYTAHKMPTGATPVPPGADGKRKQGPWEFHYDGYKNPEMPFRRGATTSNMFPKELKGYLDIHILKKL